MSPTRASGTAACRIPLRHCVYSHESTLSSFSCSYRSYLRANSLELYKIWAERLQEEFFRQGDEERRRGLPISAFMDRERPRLAQSQVNFIEFIALPLFQCIAVQLERPEIVSQTMQNLEYWRRQAAAEASSPSPSSGASS